MSNSYFSDIGGNFRGFYGENLGIVNQYIITQKSEAEIRSKKLIRVSPYLGLDKFQIKDKDKFFGREQWIIELSKHLEKDNVLLLLGASGNGKSSLIRAGLIPKLEETWGSFINLTFEPDVNPFVSLYACLVIQTQYRQSEAEIARTVKEDTLVQVVNSLKRDSRWLIFIDQFEELFTRTQKPECDKFVASLVRLIKEQDSMVKIVLTMRADFLDRLSPYPGLGTVHDRYSRMLTDMSDSELKLAIAEPAARNGVTFEKDLVKRIIDDFRQQAGSLPLLQYTLKLLWEKDDIEDRVLNTKTYEELGGITGALNQQANNIYDKELNKQEKEAAKQIFLELVNLADGKPTSRRVNKSIFEDGTVKGRVLEKLIENRLLVSRGEKGQATVEVAHEALLTSWTKLQNLIKDNLQAIAIRNRLYDDVAQWKKTKNNADLWRGSKLTQVVELREDDTFNSVLGGFSKDANQFIDVSVGLHKRQRRRIIIALSSFSAFALCLAALAGWQWRQAEIGQIRALRTSSEALSESNPFEALKESLRAGKKLKQPLLQVLTPDVQLRNRVIATLQKTVYTVKERKRLAVPQSMLLNAIFSPDGRLLVTTGTDGSVRLWNLDGKPLDKFTGHRDRIMGVSFSPDGRLIATAGQDRTVRLWDLKGKQIDRCIGHTAEVWSVSFSPYGNLIASAAKDKTARLWDLNCKPLDKFTGHTERLSSVSFSSDGQQLATTSADGTTRLWNLTGQQLKELRGHRSKSWVTSVSFSPDGKLLATAGGDGSVCLWDLEGDQKCNGFLAHSGWVIWLSFSPDGRFLATAGEDGIARLWNLKGQKIADFAGHINRVTRVSFQADGKLLATVGEDGTTRLWDLEGKQLVKFTGVGGQVSIIRFSPSRQELATAEEDGTARLWDLDGTQLTVFPASQSPVTGESPADFCSVTGESPADFRIVPRVSFSPNGRLLATARKDGTVHLWNVDDQQLLAKFRGHRSEMYNLSFSPDSRLLATAGQDCTARLWDLSGNLIAEFLGHKRKVWSVVFTPDGQQLVTSSDDGTTRLWDLQGKQLNSFQSGYLGGGDFVSISPDGLLATSGYHGIVELWNLSGKQVKQVAKCEGYPRTVTDVNFSRDGKQLATAHADGTARVWNLSGQSCQQLAEFKHGTQVESVSFSPDGNLLATASSDGTAKLWQIESFDELMVRGCDWVQEYHKNDPNVSESDKKLCL
ncbi:MAG: hypothetical protein QNJ32_31240 [Xenococcaceae cyanobacterium MO_167.B27]|nr:hypothetical protein [Xenococcaceae cyanobacterium MO_167.B27]